MIEFDKIPLQDYNKSVLADLYGFESHSGFRTYFEKIYPEIFVKLEEMDIEYRSSSLRRLPARVVRVFFDLSYIPTYNSRIKKIIERI